MQHDGPFDKHELTSSAERKSLASVLNSS